MNAFLTGLKDTFIKKEDTRVGKPTPFLGGEGWRGGEFWKWSNTTWSTSRRVITPSRVNVNQTITVTLSLSLSHRPVVFHYRHVMPDQILELGWLTSTGTRELRESENSILLPKKTVRDTKERICQTNYVCQIGFKRLTKTKVITAMERGTSYSNTKMIWRTSGEWSQWR